jgi:hypothetical protein
MNFREVIMKYGSLIVFIRPDPAEIRRLVGQTPLAVYAWVEGAVFPVFLWVVFLAQVLQMRGFLRKQAWYFTESEYNKGTAPTESVSGWGGLCEREAETSR